MRQVLAVVGLVMVAGCSDVVDFPGPPPPVRLYSTLGTGASSTLMSVSSSTVEQDVVGMIGATPQQYSLARDPVSGDLFGVALEDATAGVVTRISPATGHSTVVGRFPARLSALAFAPDGRLFATAWPTDLVTLDLLRQELTVVGTISEGEAIMSIDFDEHGSLLAIAEFFPPAGHQSLLTLDPTTAAVTSSVALTGDLEIGDIACAPDGFVYGTNFSWALIRINPRSGAEQAVGFGDVGALSGLAVAP